jgi:hypothetical protein
VSSLDLGLIGNSSIGARVGAYASASLRLLQLQEVERADRDAVEVDRDCVRHE